LGEEGRTSSAWKRVGEGGREWGMAGEMAHTMYAHMNK
jgi:hypothetical protein